MKCSFCGGQLRDGRGKMFVKNDGKIHYFCNSKCQKSWNMKRNPKKMKWTEVSRSLRVKA